MSNSIVAFLLSAALAAATADVQVTTLDGRTVEGTLSALAADRVVVLTPGGEQTLAARDILSVAAKRHAGRLPGSGLAPPVTVQLVDGSTVAASAFVVTQRRAEVTGMGTRQPVSIPTAGIQWVLFRQQSDELRQQWEAIVRDETLAGDALVLRKSAGEDEAAEVALDHVEGVVGDVTGETIAFTLDDTQVEVPRKRVEGVIYYQRRSEAERDAVCQVTGVHGSRWNARTLSLDGDAVRLVTLSGVAATLPLEEVVTLDYSVGNLVMLHTLAPESVDFRPRVSGLAPKSLVRWFSYRPQVSDPMLLAGRQYTQGLALRSRTQIRFRLGDSYQRFRATVGIDDRYRETGGVRLVVLGDNERLLERNIDGRDPPFELDVDVRDVRRLTILVEYGEDGWGWGDRLNLCNARLTK